MMVGPDSIKVGRVLSRDDDFLVVEVGRHDKVTFHLTQNEEGETVGGDEFVTLMFVRPDSTGDMEVWEP